MTLSKIGRLADRHWRKHRPNMVKHLEAQGVYEAVLLETQERALEALADLISLKGATPAQARELVMTQMIYLPDEKEVPVLDPDQMPYIQPQEKPKQKE